MATKCVRFLWLRKAELIWASSTFVSFTHPLDASQTGEIYENTDFGVLFCWPFLPLLCPCRRPSTRCVPSSRMRCTRYGGMQLKVQEAMRKKEKFQREHEEVSDVFVGVCEMMYLHAKLVRAGAYLCVSVCVIFMRQLLVSCSAVIDINCTRSLDWIIERNVDLIKTPPPKCVCPPHSRMCLHNYFDCTLTAGNVGI